jgi:hypothetical protein
MKCNTNHLLIIIYRPCNIEIRKANRFSDNVSALLPDMRTNQNISSLDNKKEAILSEQLSEIPAKG